MYRYAFIYFDSFIKGVGVAKNEREVINVPLPKINHIS